MKKVLITGAAGFIGSNLIERLLKEGRYEVIGVDNLSAGSLEQIPSSLEFHALDIRSPAIYPLCKGVDVIFHLAAKNCIYDCQQNPVETVDINVMGTVNVLEAARKAGVKKVIYAESSALYEGIRSMPTAEKDIQPESFYAASKGAARLLAQCYERYSNLALTALRYFCVYGPKQDYRRTIPPLMSSFIIHLLQGKNPVIYGSGAKRRDFVYIDDINDFHVQAINDERTNGKTFNLGSGKNYSVQEIFEKIKHLLSSPLKPIYLPDLPGEAESTLACIKEAKALGWMPKTSLDEGLKLSIQFIKERVLCK